MPQDLKVSQIGDFSAAASIQGTSLSRSKKTLSNYLRLLFPEIVYYLHCWQIAVRANSTRIADTAMVIDNPG